MCSVTYFARASPIYSFHEKYRKYKTFANIFNIQHSFIRFDGFWFRCNRRHMSVLVFFSIHFYVAAANRNSETQNIMFGALCTRIFSLSIIFSHIWNQIESLGVFNMYVSFPFYACWLWKSTLSSGFRMRRWNKYNNNNK